MKKSVYLLAFLTSFLLCVALTSKVMHWPYAYIEFTAGMAIFTLGFLPLYFFQKIKAA